MRRRRLLGSLAVVSATTAGCTSGPSKDGPKWGPPETEPDEPTRDRSTRTTANAGEGFEVQFDIPNRTETDGFVVVVTVTNTSAAPNAATLVVTWSKDGDQRVHERDVSLDAGESVDFEFEFPEAGNLNFDWEEP
jgi:hypothetical protein